MKRVMKRKVSGSSSGRKRSTPKPSVFTQPRRGNAKAGAAVDASGAKLGVERDARALGANTIVESEEKREPASDIDTGVVAGLKVLDPERPIREAAAEPTSVDVSKAPLLVYRPRSACCFDSTSAIEPFATFA